MKIFFLIMYSVFVIEVSGSFKTNPLKDLIFVYDKIDPAISFDEFVRKIDWILPTQHQVFKKFSIVFATQSDVLEEEIFYENDRKIVKSKMDRIKKEKRIESPMKALLRALQISSPNSLIYVFTLAHPENSLLLHDILELVEIKKIEVGFALDWKHFSEGIPEEYLNISYVGNGVIYDDILQIFNFMQYHFPSYKDYYKVNLLTINSDKNNNYNVSIDYFSGREVTISFSKISYMAYSYYYPPRLSVSGNECKIQIINPYTSTRDTPILDIRTTPTNRDESYTHFIRIFSFSDFNSYFNFDYGFSTNRVSSMQETSPKSILDTPNYIYIQPTTSIYNADLQHCEIIAPNGDIEDKIQLRKRNGSDFYSGLFEPSSKKHYYLRITAIVNGKSVQRMSSNGISSMDRFANENKPFCSKFEECLIWYALISGVVFIAIALIVITVWAKSIIKYHSVRIRHRTTIRTD